MATGPWAKIRCAMFRDTKVASLTDSQAVTFIKLILWSQEQETDGQVPEAALRLAAVKRQHVDALDAIGLVTRTDDGWRITNFLDHQTSARARSDKARHAANARWGNDA